LAAPLKLKLNGGAISLEGFGKINLLDGKPYIMKNGKSAYWILLSHRS
jgi:hypothetical protein